MSQTVAALVSMTTNFLLNNELTYADKKLRGGRFWVGLVTFYAGVQLRPHRQRLGSAI